MSSLIVDVVQVEEVQKHPNADRLEIVRVKGWHVVSGIGQFNVGDKAVYFPPDTVISEELAQRFGIMNYVSELPKNPDGTRPPGRRIKAARLRGAQSFGFITKPDDDSWPVGMSVVQHYGATKYEPVVRDPDGDEASPIAAFHKYTDIENLRNFPGVFQDGEEVVITEKIHGTNARVASILQEVEGIKNRLFVAGSRTTRKKEPREGNPSLYWKALTPEVERMLTFETSIGNQFADADMIVFGEIYGAKVQDLSYGLTTQQFRAFDISVNDRYLNFDEFAEITTRYGIETVPILYRGPYSAEIVAQFTDGPTTLCEPEKAGKFKGREGVVVRPVKERIDPMIGRVVLKSISVDYLSRKGGTENH